MNYAYQELDKEVHYYRRLFELMKIHPLLNGGTSWSLGDRNSIHVTQFCIDGQILKKPISSKEFATIAIAISLGSDTTSADRIQEQSAIIAAGIVTVENIEKSTRRLTSIAKDEHLKGEIFQQHATENAAKVCVLIQAYEKMTEYLISHQEDLHNPEYMVLLGYIIAILGYRYSLRPYMINPNLIHVSWPQIYDSMFNNFSDDSKQQYIDAGYYSLWEVFKSIADEIRLKKETKKGAESLIARARNGVDANVLLKRIFTQSPPSVSNHQQDQQSP